MIHFEFKDKKQIFKEISRLTNLQTAEGSWFDISINLESIIDTCQMLLLLSEFNSNFQDKIDKAKFWITSNAVTFNEYSYWRTLPLIKINAEKHLVNAAFNHTENIFHNSIRHHINSPILPFFLEVSTILTKFSPIFHQTLEIAKNDIINSKEECTPEYLTYRYYTLKLNNTNDKQIVDSFYKELKKRITHEQNCIKYTYSLVSSCYVSINLMDIYNIENSDEKDKIKVIIDGLIKYIFERWKKQDFNSQPLAGGELNNQELYSKILCFRALVKYLNTFYYDWYKDLIVSKKEMLTIKKKYFIYIFCLSVLYGIFRLVNSKFAFMPTETKWDQISHIADILGIIGFFISIFLYFIPTDKKK